MADWSNMQARCWFTYTDAVDGKRYPCTIRHVIPVAGDLDMIKVDLDLSGIMDRSSHTLFADRVEVCVDGKWRTVLDVWQEENVPTHADLVKNLDKVMNAPLPRVCVTEGCDGVIHPTGKRGRPATKCDECRGVA